MVCQFLLYNKANQLYIYICSRISSLLHLPPSHPPYPTPLGGHKAQSREISSVPLHLCRRQSVCLECSFLTLLSGLNIISTAVFLMPSITSFFLFLLYFPLTASKSMTLHCPYSLAWNLMFSNIGSNMPPPTLSSTALKKKKKSIYIYIYIYI